jgi:transcriptional regulator of arginine metabolism
MTSPHTMRARRAIVADLIASESVASQEDLLELLHVQGFNVTQATVSRDLDALGAVKQNNSNGTSRYVIPERIATDTSLPSGVSEQDLVRVCGEVLLRAQSAGNITVLHTPPGAAQYLAGYLDRSRIFDNVGTVAGDDTIMIVMPDSKAANDLCKAVLGWAEAHR